MASRLVNLALLAALLGAAPAAAQQFIQLPLGGAATDITPDGQVVVGTAGNDSYIWRWRVDPAPTIIPGGYITGISDDGTVACGNVTNPLTGKQTAARWTAATDWELLPVQVGLTSCDFFLTSAYDISGDGQAIVGLAWKSCSGVGFRWTAATGMQALQDLEDGHNRCSAISGDGSTMGGFAQGNFSRTPAYWAPNTTGFVIDPNFQGEVYGFTENGGYSVGVLASSSFFAFLRNKQTGALTNLGNLNGIGWSGNAMDVSEDLKTIVGFDNFQFAREAWIWKQGTGIVSLDSKMAALGVPHLPKFATCLAVSDDGNVIVGSAFADEFQFGTSGYIVELSSANPQWTMFGNGLAGVSGYPYLKGTGPLTPGSVNSIKMTNGPQFAQAALIVGVSTIYAPFKGGVLVPSINILLDAQFLDYEGSYTLPFIWPAGLPSGASIYWQMWNLDPNGPVGFSASNALRSKVP